MLCDYGCGREATFHFKNGKHCCERNQSKCPEIIKKFSLKLKESYQTGKRKRTFDKVHKCPFCNNSFTSINIKRHQENCHMNPNVQRLCPVCSTPIKSKWSKTCSKSCSGKLFIRVWKDENLRSYRTICFRNHPHKCIICGEENIVVVHHVDHNRENSSPENLIPLCSTHHDYMHSRFKVLIIKQVEEYLRGFKNKNKN